MLEQEIHFPEIHSFPFSIAYEECDPEKPENRYESHVHAECEIVFHLAGDVSFIVEHRIYPLTPGSIIITRPYEYHHCVYHSNAVHKHFCIRFSAQQNEWLFPLFFERSLGERNFLQIPDREEEFETLCQALVGSNPAPDERYWLFFQLMHLLAGASAGNSLDRTPRDVLLVLEYINENPADSTSIRTLARRAHVSVNTLERHFLNYIHLTPSEYRKKKRLARAAELLSTGISVTEISEKCGFSDCSNFIVQFKKAYGITPLQYKVRLQQK